MGNHSNQQLQQHVDSNSDLVAKMNSLTEQLQTNLLANFQGTMGVPLPSALQANVRQFTYDMVYSTDPIIDEYMSGAKTLLDAAFSGNEVAIADKALDVVQVLLNNVVGGSSIQTGGNSQSEILTDKDGKKVVSAAFTEVQLCDAQDWLTQTNFYLNYYIFVVWYPTDEDVAKIAGALAEA